MWVYLALSATLLSVTGQLLIKKAVGTPLHIACSIAVTTGLIGLIGLAYLQKTAPGRHRIEPCVVIAGTAFFAANVLWIYALQRSSNMSLVRAAMAGLEIALLAVLAFYLYNQTLTKKQLGGIALVMAGIACIAGII